MEKTQEPKLSKLENLKKKFLEIVEELKKELEKTSEEIKKSMDEITSFSNTGDDDEFKIDTNCPI
jgi:DNA-binding protein H-NS